MFGFIERSAGDVMRRAHRQPVGAGNGPQRLTARDSRDDLGITAGGGLSPSLAATDAAARLRLGVPREPALPVTGFRLATPASPLNLCERYRCTPTSFSAAASLLAACSNSAASKASAPKPKTHYPAMCSWPFPLRGSARTSAQPWDRSRSMALADTLPSAAPGTTGRGFSRPGRDGVLPTSLGHGASYFSGLSFGLTEIPSSDALE